MRRVSGEVRDGIVSVWLWVEVVARVGLPSTRSWRRLLVMYRRVGS